MFYTNCIDQKQRDAVDACCEYIMKELNKSAKTEVQICLDCTYDRTPCHCPQIFYFDNYFGVKVPYLDSLLAAHYLTLLLRKHGYFVAIKTKNTTHEVPEMVVAKFPISYTDIGGPTNLEV